MKSRLIAYCNMSLILPIIFSSCLLSIQAKEPQTIHMLPKNETSSEITKVRPIHVKWVNNSKAYAIGLLNKLDQTATIAERIVQISKALLGVPYSAFSLDKLPIEKLIIDFTSFDCFLFIEQLLAISQSENIQQFEVLISKLRYRNENISYCTRHHYFTQWAMNAEKVGLLTELSQKLKGSQSRLVKLNFISMNPTYYKPMMNNNIRNCIQGIEKSLEVSQHFIPLNRITAIQRDLENGDLFGLVTNVKGLDVTHTGIVEVTPTSINAIHAAPNVGVIRSRDIARYAQTVPDVIGISFYRPIKPIAKSK